MTSHQEHASRRIVITGATRGLGRALAERFAALGLTVIGCGRSEPALRVLRETLGTPHRFDAVDVADAEAVTAWAESVLGTHGAPHVLLNNAALMNSPAPLWRVSADVFDAMLRVNLGGIANTVRAFVPSMIAAGRGVVVNVSSGWGRATAPEVAPYCATKWGVEGLTRALASELPPGLAAVPLNPGIIDTDMLRTCWAEDAGRFPSPAEWVETAADFILSLGPEHNGQPVTVPG